MTTYDEYGMPVGAYVEPESLPSQALRVIRAFVTYRVKPVVDKRVQHIKRRNWSIWTFLTLVNVLVVSWFVALYWGERSQFTSTVNSCRWEDWENWAPDASPHRLVFIADPQLVDPHTYPGRPWPLSTLTVKHTDLYLRRVYARIQEILYPDSVIFLGDLFDGGREWSTYSSVSPEEQWRKYGNNFWLKEYDRFGRIFFGLFGIAGTTPRPNQPGRKIISSLPGNHDLGFGKGVQMAVRRRYIAYFGDGNRIDVIGNHTFVSVDTVSLSALGQENPESVQELWKPAMDFLDNAPAKKRNYVLKELRKQRDLQPNLPYSHGIVELNDLAKAELPKPNYTITEFPTILLTHVPLYRGDGTPCGPLREHWPPTAPPKGQQPLEKDDRNAIAVRGGYQYQNVLTREITKEIAEKVGNIQYAFSGDDHDYCEVVHRGYPSAGGGIREITVKSISWAMGVRHPGFEMVSMWNPVDEFGNPLSKEPTIQTHLCLLPDQLGIFIRYATIFSLTMLTLAIRALLIMTGRLSSTTQPSESPILPTSTLGSSAEDEKARIQHSRRPPSNDTISSNSSTSSERGNLLIRNANAKRSISPSGGYGLPLQHVKYTYPLVQHAGYYGDEDKDEAKVTTSRKTKTSVKKKGLALFWREFRNSVLKVAVVVLPWYSWLIWHG
ncbi:hypothetical protein GQ43DRAFT_389325 [Delitschia confertaspora ATCC 74209]|uniref:Calcineurin-like phosphoesterase domain-containing protein n=1 Tax=Delitschia confertaspora ATCC 74209 TaxID=1513339 RepID=A0A9P4JQJ2_9PLEO|nr:hypothetical protein GQ43DRAFT_389325 [Delitschia confertaspora ATCC 74209]